MEAIKTFRLKERPIDLSMLYRRIKELEKKIAHLSDDGSTLNVRTHEGLQIIPYHDLIRCQSANNYTILYLRDKRKICVSKTLKYIQKQLCGESFIRIHASHIVSKKEIRQILTSQGKTIVLANGECLPISRSYQSSIDWAFNC